jgi:hypothetical protein
MRIGSGVSTSPEVLEQVRELLIDHVRTEFPDGPCACGFKVCAGQSFARHQAQVLASAGLLRQIEPSDSKAA